MNKETQAKMPLQAIMKGEVEIGCWRKLSDILPLVVPAYHLTSPKLQVKISGDGRKCGRRRQQVVITASLLSAGDVSCSPHHHYSLAIWQGKEDYEEMKNYLSALIDDLEKLQRLGILIETRKEVDLFLSRDSKFMAIVLGLVCAFLDKGFCLWCLAGKKDIGTKDLFELRNMAEVLRAFSECKTPPVGQQRAPLFPFIPFQRVLIDPLHAFLRIGGKLIELAWEEALRTDAGMCTKCTTSGKKKTSCAADCTCLCHSPIKEKITNEMLRLKINHFEFFFSKLDKNKLDWTSLQGNEISDVLKNFDLEKIFPKNRADVRFIFYCFSSFESQ